MTLLDAMARELVAGIRGEPATRAGNGERMGLLDYARAMNSRYQVGPHHELIAGLLERVERGEMDRLMIWAPPRHGKSHLAAELFPAWYIGRHPDRRVIGASYGDRLAQRTSRRVRNQIADARYPFEGVAVAGDKGAVTAWDIAGHGGGYWAAGVGSAVTGEGADLLVIDDPVKSRAQADSATYREAAWEWYRNDIYTRLMPGAAVVLMLTRWHEDDLAGRLLEDQERGGDRWHVLSLPALAEAGDPLGRKPGAALWPAWYDRKALLRIRTASGGENSRAWTSLYQQRPAPQEGSMLKREWFKIVPEAPADLETVGRAWDEGATEGGGDPTAGALVGYKAGVWYVMDMVRAQASPAGVDALMDQAAEMDGRDVPIYLQQDPGSAGKARVASHMRRLKGRAVFAQPPTGSKIVRAQPFAAAAEAGNVRLVKGAWNREFIEECAVFPNGAHDDQVDAVSWAMLMQSPDEGKAFEGIEGFNAGGMLSSAPMTGYQEDMPEREIDDLADEWGETGGMFIGGGE